MIPAFRPEPDLPRKLRERSNHLIELKDRQLLLAERLIICYTD